MDTNEKAAQQELDRAQLIFDEGYFEEAYDIAKKIPNVTPDIQRDRQLLLADIWEGKENYEQAENILLKLAENFPEHDEVLEKIGTFYFNQAKLKEALPFLRKALTQNPENVILTFLAYIAELKTESTEPEIPEIMVDFSGDHPGFYLCRAALKFHRNEPAAAYYFIQAAQQFFPAGDTVKFLGPMIQMGWTIPGELYLIDLTSSK